MDAPGNSSPTIHTAHNDASRADQALEADGSEQQETEKKSTICRMSYTALVAQYPGLVFLATLLLIVVCALCSFLPAFGAPDLPDFSKPVEGFEPRGTTINTRWRTRFLYSEAMSAGLLSPAPVPQKKIPKVIPHLPDNTARQTTGRNASTAPIKLGKGLTMCDGTGVFVKEATKLKTVFAPIRTGDSLMASEHLKAMCRLEELVLRDFPGFDRGCFHQHDGQVTQECCPSWSVGNFVATLRGRPTCHEINETDVQYVLELLRDCAPFFRNRTLKENCWSHQKMQPSCRTVPSECARDNAVYNILYYLTDQSFVEGPQADDVLRYSLVLTPHTANKQFTVDVFKKHLNNGPPTDTGVELVATDYDQLKFVLFNELLIADIIYPAIAMLIILAILWFYTESVLLTLLLLLSVVSALVVAYFIYMVVFSLKFFPFLNVTTLIFLVGIGADDAFVFTDVWRQAKKYNPGACLTKITAETFKHASMSMFVTSFTTAAAFIANFSSQITTIKCFGLFAGIAVLCKFLMMITWFPAVAVINEKWCVSRPSCFACLGASSPRTNKCFLRSCYENTLRRLARRTFDYYLPWVVIQFRFLWTFLFLSLTIGGLIVLTVEPGFRLPTSADFQMFKSSHPLESYALHYKNKFRFEASASGEGGVFPIDMFWGLKAVDTGDSLDPTDHGQMEWDGTFDVISPASQRWLMQFCKRIRAQDFAANESPEMAQGCFLETFYNQSCITSQGVPLYPCCRNSSFPFDKATLDECAVQRLVSASRKTDPSAFIYDASGNIRGLHLRVMSNHKTSHAYHPQQEFWERVEAWVTQELATAPAGMRNGWFVSDVQFYSLQRSLSSGMLASLGISISMAFAVMLLTTLNILVSVYAILSIVGIISVTLGSLVLSGWRLNILESITMSVAVGVAVDFAMHFGVAYCLAPNKSCRKSRVTFSISRMGSAITMAAVTTFIAGSMMMPSAVLSYLQMGHFLMLVMAVSWAFSTFFFQSLCSIAGPQGEWGQLSWARITRFCCGRGTGNEAGQRTEIELDEAPDAEKGAGRSGDPLLDSNTA